LAREPRHLRLFRPGYHRVRKRGTFAEETERLMLKRGSCRDQEFESPLSNAESAANCVASSRQSKRVRVAIQKQ
jgi:hypothetical protein